MANSNPACHRHAYQASASACFVMMILRRGCCPLNSWQVWLQIRLWQALCVLSPAVLPEERGATLEQLHTILEVCVRQSWPVKMA